MHFFQILINQSTPLQAKVKGNSISDINFWVVGADAVSCGGSQPASNCVINPEEGCHYCLPQLLGSHASWKVLDFFTTISRTWKVLENEFGPGIYLWFYIINLTFMNRTPYVNEFMKHSCYVLTRQLLCNL